MSFNSTSLKSRIRGGERLIGASIPMKADADWLKSVVERKPYDFVSVDGQHAPYNEDRLVEFCKIAEDLDIHVQFRIKHTRHTYLVGNILDLGPAGIEVPQVELESTVDEAVANFYYPQQGVRSWGGTTRLGLGQRPEIHEYSDWWAEIGVLWMQIESVQAVSNARKLAKPGVDCLSFGPADLRLSLEAQPNHPFKDIDDCARYVLGELEGTGVRPCMRIPDPALTQKYLDMGVTMLLEQGVS